MVCFQGPTPPHSTVRAMGLQGEHGPLAHTMELIKHRDDRPLIAGPNRDLNELLSVIASKAERRLIEHLTLCRLITYLNGKRLLISACNFELSTEGPKLPFSVERDLKYPLRRTP